MPQSKYHAELEYRQKLETEIARLTAALETCRALRDYDRAEIARYKIGLTRIAHYKPRVDVTAETIMAWMKIEARHALSGDKS